MEMEIANNIKAVELLKVELLRDLTRLFADIAADVDSETLERIAKDSACLIHRIYLLGSRLGVTAKQIDVAMQQMLTEGIEENRRLEERSGELQQLLSRLETRRSDS